MYNNMLPIGSVVLLKGGNKKIMITGRILTKQGEDQIYDYAACYYPEGVGSTKGEYFFNRDAIDTVFFIGYEDESEIQLRENVFEKLGELEVRDGRIVPKGTSAGGAA